MLTPLITLVILACQPSPPQAVANVHSVDNPSHSSASAPNLVADGSGALMTWFEPADVSGTQRVRFSRYDDGQFREPSTITTGAEYFVNWADFPSVIRGSDGHLMAHWAEKSGSAPYAYDVMLATSDTGQQWTGIGTAHKDGTTTEHGFVSMSADPAGGVRAIWLDGREMAHDKPMTLRTARIDSGLHDERLLDARTCECCGTAMTTTSKGLVIAYRDRGESEQRDIGIIRFTDEGWSTSTAVHNDGWTIDGCPVNGPALASIEDSVVLAWYTSPNNRPQVRLAFSPDAGEHWSPPVAIDSATESATPLGRVAVELVSPTQAMVIWMDSTDKAGRILARLVDTEGTRGPVVTLAATSEARASGFPVTARVSGGVLLAYTVPGNTSVVKTVLIDERLYKTEK